MASGWRKAATYAHLEDSSARQWAWEFLRRNPGYRAAWEAGDTESATSWGLVALADPSGTCPHFLPPTYGGMLIGERDAEVAVPAGQVLIGFDLNQPLAPQLKKAGRDLRLVQQMEPQIGTIAPPVFRRQRRDKWTTYLRVLDAEAEGVSHAKIAECLFPDRPDEYPDHKGRRAVADLLRQARQLIDGGYRMLLGLGD